jgi:hypothetical protein
MTVAMATLMMILRVRSCDAVSAAHTALLRDFASAAISSATGSMFRAL